MYVCMYVVWWTLDKLTIRLVLGMYTYIMYVLCSRCYRLYRMGTLSIVVSGNEKRSDTQSLETSEKREVFERKWRLKIGNTRDDWSQPIILRSR